MKKLEALNGLRVLAALGIFLFHAGLLPYGSFPVTFFFMLSGFMMYYTKKEIIMPLAGLQKMRKMYLMHFMTMLVALLIFKGEIIAARGEGYLPKAVFLHTLLLQAWFPKYTFTLNRLSWYLSVTFFLYAISYPLVLFVRKIYKIYLASLTLLVGILLCDLVSRYIYVLPMYSNPLYRVMDFLLGMMIAEVYFRSDEGWLDKITPAYKTLIEMCLVAILGIQYGVTVINSSSSCAEFSVVFSLMLFFFAKGGGAVSRFLSTSPFQMLAKYTFEFYMIHELWIRIIRIYFTEETQWFASYWMSYLARSIVVAALALIFTGMTIFLYNKMRRE